MFWKKITLGLEKLSQKIDEERFVRLELMLNENMCGGSRRVWHRLADRRRGQAALSIHFSSTEM